MGTVIGEGIDTSKHQASKVDYHKYKQAGGSFVILRVGCGKTKDKCFEQDYASALAAGLKVAVYFYTYSTDEAGARADASRVLGWLAGRGAGMPVAYDIEDPIQQGSSRKRINSQMYNAFSAQVRAGGYRPMLYTGEYFFNTYFDSPSVHDPIWIAKYSSKLPSIGREYAIWQYSSSRVSAPYFNGDLDRNRMYVDVFGYAVPDVPMSNPYPVPTRTLKRSIPMMKGNDVKWLQYELKKHGLIENGGVDGSFGDKTLAAVRVYQSTHDGLVVDGKVGPATRWSLQNS